MTDPALPQTCLAKWQELKTTVTCSAFYKEFPVNGSLAHLFGIVQRTLINEKPPEAWDHLKKYLEVDRPLRQGFQDLSVVTAGTRGT